MWVYTGLAIPVANILECSHTALVETFLRLPRPWPPSLQLPYDLSQSSLLSSSLCPSTKGSMEHNMMLPASHFNMMMSSDQPVLMAPPEERSLTVGNPRLNISAYRILISLYIQVPQEFSSPLTQQMTKTSISLRRQESFALNKGCLLKLYA